MAEKKRKRGEVSLKMSNGDLTYEETKLAFVQQLATSQALSNMCIAGNEEGAEKMLALGGDVNFNWKINYRPTALQEACKSKKGLVKFLLDNGADVKAANALNVGYKSMLLVACESGNTEGVKALIAHGEEINQMLKTKISFLITTEQLRNCTVQNKYLWPLLLACLRGQFQVALCLVQIGSQFVDPGKGNTQPIHVACGHFGIWYQQTKYPKEESDEAVKFVELIIQRGAAFNETRQIMKPRMVLMAGNRWQTFKETHVETPLHIAVKKGFVDMVWLLVSYGANFVFNIPCFCEDKEVSVWDLNEDIDVHKALRNTWTPVDHFRFPTVVRKGIVSFLLVHKILKWNFQRHIIHLICQFIAYGWLQSDGDKNNN